jgi:hypothetical protein
VEEWTGVLFALVGLRHGADEGVCGARGGLWRVQYEILVVGGLLERVCSRFGVLRFGCWMRKSDVTFGGRAGPCGFD